jgi:enamine deaminase RidA (YjgF/YER057c/UK114 family)
MQVEYLTPAGQRRNPAYSTVVVIPPGATLVMVGGQNAVNAEGELVGGDDIEAQAQQVRDNLGAALTVAGCTWADVVRVSVVIKMGSDLRKAFAAFQPVLSGREAPPLVGVAQVVALARPEFLIEVGLEAVR